MSKLDYRIIVPSKGRSHLMRKLLVMLPAAMVCVEESEVEIYSKVVPKNKLIPHPPLPGLIAKRNWMMDHIDGECQIQIDDDMDHMRRLIGGYKTIRDPEWIQAVLENGYVVARDLELGVFSWSRVPNRMMTKPEISPFRLVGVVGNCFGLVGSGRNRHFDPAFTGRGDINFTMQTLLEDRIVLIDNRYFFNHGEVFSGKGGLNATVADRQAEWEKAGKRLLQTWVGCLEISKPSGAGGTSKYNDPIRIKVNRKNPAAVV